MSLMLKFSWEMLFFESGDTEVLKLIEISCLQVIKGKLTVRLTKSGCLTCFTHICQLCVPTIVEVSLKRFFFFTQGNLHGGRVEDHRMMFTWHLYLLQSYIQVVLYLIT